MNFSYFKYPLILLFDFLLLPVFLRWDLCVTVPLLLLGWVTTILIFSSIYVHIDASNLDVDCGLGDPGTAITFPTAFAFSLETCTTVGCE